MPVDLLTKKLCCLFWVKACQHREKEREKEKEREREREREKKITPTIRKLKSASLSCKQQSKNSIRYCRVIKQFAFGQGLEKRWICWDVLDLFLSSFHVSVCFMKFLVHWEGVLPSFHVSVRFLHERHVYGLAELISCLPC